MTVHANNGSDNVHGFSAKRTESEDVGGEKVTRTTTTTVEVEGVGFFGRMKRRLENNPIRTTLGIVGTVALGAAGGYNYNQTGSVLGNRDADDVAEAASAVAGLIFSK